MTAIVSRPVLTLPGLSGSGPQHWQTRWEKLHGFQRVEQADWEHPQLTVWLECLTQVLSTYRQPVLLAAHSLGAVLVAHAAAHLRAQIAGALLVAPADVDDPACTPEITRSFAPLPRTPLGFPAVVVASSNDPYVTLTRAQHLASAWQAQFVDAGAIGHINAESGLDDWPIGYRILETIARR